EGIFVGYSTISKAFKLYNIRTRKVEENMHITVLENKPMIAGGGQEWLFDIDALSKSMNYAPGPAEDTGIFDDAYDDKDEGEEADYNNLETLGRSYAGRASPFQATKCLDTGGFTSWKKSHWNKMGFAHVARIEAIRLFLAYASFTDFIVYQMDVKSAFLYGTIEKEVYVSQSPSFVDPELPNRVYKVEKALYGLHQAPRAWYETLSTYLLDNGFKRGKINKTLFIKQIKNDIILVQVYVDDIIFGSIKRSLSTEFEQPMHKRFQMSYMRELAFFLGLHVEQRKDGIFLSQDKYVCDILKKVGFSSVKSTSTPMETHKPLSKDAAGTDVEVYLYSLDRKSTTRDCQFLSSKLISWQCKKQTIVANSTTDVEQTAASNYCGQFLWLQNQLLDYGYNFM
nr:retrovirus-related Pol polyprotein from transposon TNT 1-94 [Tanacetum cinerariifolium]